MNKLAALALLAACLVAPGFAEARGYRNGTVSTPFGSINTNSPAYQMSGGDPFTAMQIQQYMNMMNQQQKMMQAEMKAFQQRMKSDPAFRKAVEAEQARLQAQMNAELQKPAKKKKKRPTLNGSAASSSAIKSRNDDKTTADEKPAAPSAGSDLKNRRDDDKPSTSATDKAGK